MAAKNSGPQKYTSLRSKLNNAGWYSVDANLAVTNDVNDGPYSGFLLGISKLKVNGTEYSFPAVKNPNPNGEWFGNPSTVWQQQNQLNGYTWYSTNFNGITMSDAVTSLKTVLTVEPAILGTPSTSGYDSKGLATDPYKYIKVEGRINK